MTNLWHRFHEWRRRAPDDQSDGLEVVELDEVVVSRPWRARARFTLASLAVAILVLFIFERSVVPVKSGQAGVLFQYFTGTKMEKIYAEGVHIIWPWDRMFIYNTRLETTERQFEFLSREGLSLVVHVAIRYRVDVRLLPLLHTQIGPDYLNKIVVPQTQAVLRRAIGLNDAEQVYSSKPSFLEGIADNSLTEAARNYILIDDVMLRSVELPQAIRGAIERKQTLAEDEKSYVSRLEIERKEADRKLIEAKGIQAYQETIRQSLTADLLRWQGIQATRELAASPNAKSIVIGAGKDGLPLILGGDR